MSAGTLALLPGAAGAMVQSHGTDAERRNASLCAVQASDGAGRRRRLRPMTLDVTDAVCRAATRRNAEHPGQLCRASWRAVCGGYRTPPDGLQRLSVDLAVANAAHYATSVRMLGFPSPDRALIDHRVKPRLIGFIQDDTGCSPPRRT